MPMRAKREVHRLRVTHRGSRVGCPLHTKSFSLPLPPPAFPLSASTLNGQLPEYRSQSISEMLQPILIISKLARFVICSVCNLLSINEINPSENIFNNNVMQNGIRKIVKSGRFSQSLKIGLEENFILKSGRLQPHYITQNIRRYTPLQSGTEEFLVLPRKVHPPVGQIWWEAGFFDRSGGI